jgi:hypothetical protein
MNFKEAEAEKLQHSNLIQATVVYICFTALTAANIYYYVTRIRHL